MAITGRDETGASAPSSEAWLGGRHSYCRGVIELAGSEQNRTHPACLRLAHTGAVQGSLSASRA